ncbi:MAG: branched-chain amino acid ABC transporter permease [Thermodesulfobacteria bacterium]|nr:branched-chain amino acid ABC transporter permease [Thermodesulfobacteriota bacterium]
MDLLILSQFVLAGLSAGAVYALIALGFGVVHNATGIVNFAQGDFLVIGAFVAYSVLVSWGMPYWLAFLAAVLSASLVGLLLERLALSRARSKEILLLVFITVGASIFLRGIIKEIWGKRPLILPPVGDAREISLGVFAIDPQYLWIIGITLLAFVLLHFFFRYTLWGKAIRAVAVDAQAAALMGIPVPWVVAASFALAGALGGLAGVLIGPVWPLSFESGVHIGLKGFAAAVLGGYGSFGGALLGGFLLGMLEGLGAYLVSSFKNLIAYGVLLLVLLLRPQGLLGGKAEERL